MDAVLVALPFGVAIGLALGVVGGGGSILAVPVLVYVLGEPVRQATTESLAIVGTTALVAALAHSHRERLLTSVAAVFGASGAIGAVGGTALNRLASPRSIMIAFALVMLIAAYAMARKIGAATRSATRPAIRRAIPVGAAVGVLTGFFGVGGGFLIVPALVLVVGLPVALAIGTSLLVIVLTSAAALTAHLAVGEVDWRITIALTAAAVVGALIGCAAADALSGPRLHRAFALLCTGVAIFILAENVFLVG